MACLSGPRAALPHGCPSDRVVAAGEVLLFDFGAQVCGYRSDMTRTLFVGEPSARDAAIYRLVAAAQEAAFDLLVQAATAGEHPFNREVDAAARDVIVAAGQGEQFGHGLGHGIGLATHEGPSLGDPGTGAAVAVTHGLQRRARCLSRRPDRGTHRGPGRLRSGQPAL